MRSPLEQMLMGGGMSFDPRQFADQGGGYNYSPYAEEDLVKYIQSQAGSQTLGDSLGLTGDMSRQEGPPLFNRRSVNFLSRDVPREANDYLDSLRGDEPQNLPYRPGSDDNTGLSDLLLRSGTPEWSLSRHLQEKFGGGFEGQHAEPSTPAVRTDIPGGKDDGSGGDEYESLIKEYLDSLKHPLEIPKPPPLTTMQAIAITMNPDRSKELMERFREPYNIQVENMRLREEGKAKAANVAATMENRRATLALRNQEFQFRQQQHQATLRQQAYQHELALSNAGYTDWNYMNPELAGRAKQVRMDKDRTFRQREAATGPDLQKRIEQYADNLRALESMVLQGEHSLPDLTSYRNPDGSWQDADSQRSYDHIQELRRHFEHEKIKFSILQRMSPEQYRLWSQTQDFEGILDEAARRGGLQEGE